MNSSVKILTIPGETLGGTNGGAPREFCPFLPRNKLHCR